MKTKQDKADHRIVIIGAGFGGITLTRLLRKAPVEVWLLDKHNYHTFQPLLYQVATGGLEPDSIAYPVRRIIRKYQNSRFRMARVENIDHQSKTINTDIGDIPYEYLVIATGSMNNYFNFEPDKRFLLPLKSMANSLDMRSYIMQNLEKAIVTDNPRKQQKIINIAIIGGGPAGVELAGSLAEMKKYVIPKDFPELDISLMQISLFEGAPRLLPTMSEESSGLTLKYLTRMGIQVHLNSTASIYNGSNLILEDGTCFPTETVIWTAGVKGAGLKGIPETSIMAGNRILVNEFNQVIGLKDVFAIGDIASHVTTDSPKGLPMLAPVAIQQARQLSENILRQLNNVPLQPFIFKNKGTMATIGRNRAVVDLPRIKFHGTLAWFFWMFVHIMSLVGFRNKLVTFVGWLVSYISYDKPLGLIIRPKKKAV